MSSPSTEPISGSERVAAARFEPVRDDDLQVISTSSIPIQSLDRPAVERVSRLPRALAVVGVLLVGLGGSATAGLLRVRHDGPISRLAPAVTAATVPGAHPQGVAEPATTHSGTDPDTPAKEGTLILPLPGFLHDTDLGVRRGWQVGGSFDERNTDDDQPVTLPRCGTATQLTFRGKGGSQLYRTTIGQHVWTLTESVIQLDDTHLLRARSALTALRACKQLSTDQAPLQNLSRPHDTRLLAGRRVARNQIGWASGWVISDHTLLALETTPGELGTPLPGGIGWLSGLIGTALDRLPEATRARTSTTTRSG